jgi:hypothetical protein
MLTSVILFLAAAGAQAPSTQAADGGKIICKAERSVGTNLSSRICKTKAKWAEDREKARAGLADDINGRAGFPSPLDTDGTRPRPGIGNASSLGFGTGTTQN